LHNVGSIEAIHTVGPHDSSLLRLDFNSISIEVSSLIETNLQLYDEVTPVIKLHIYDSNQFTQIFPFHLFALAVEVKPRIVNILVLELLNHFAHFLAYSLLTTFLVYQIDKILAFILGVRLLKMLIGGVKTSLVVGVNYDAWAPLHRGFHLPDKGDRATNLHV
jgi:hypothetical protein